MQKVKPFKAWLVYFERQKEPDIYLKRADAVYWADGQKVHRVLVTPIQPIRKKPARLGSEG